MIPPVFFWGGGAPEIKLVSIYSPTCKKMGPILHWLPPEQNIHHNARLGRVYFSVKIRSWLEIFRRLHLGYNVYINIGKYLMIFVLMQMMQYKFSISTSWWFLKNISQIGYLPQIGMKITNL